MGMDNQNETTTKRGWLRGIPALSAYCGLSRRTISRMLAEGKLPHRRLGHRSVIFRIRDIDRTLERIGTTNYEPEAVAR